MLQRRQMIPPLTARTAAGQIVRAWDFKQKRNLAVVFLHAGCARCDAYLARLAGAAADFAAQEAVALVIFPEAVPAAWAERLKPPILAAADMSGRSQRAWLSDDCFSTAGLARVGAFVADRYGELFACWSATEADGLSGAREIVGWLSQIQVACEECGVSHWPVEG
jgi:hypothetical protein